MKNKIIFDSTKPENFWLPLDNAAKIYPAIHNNKLTAVFRISVIFIDQIQIKELIDAVKIIENRFPYYKVRLKKGFFWNYLEYNNKTIKISLDKGAYCQGFKNNNKINNLFRIVAKEKSLSVEFSHILADGGGALEFFKTLILVYFEQCKIVFSKNLFTINPYIKPNQKEEYEDSYNKFFKKEIPPLVNKCKAFHIPFPITRKIDFTTINAQISTAKILNKSKEYNVSITEYLTSVYLYALQEVYLELNQWQKRKCNKIIRIQVPVNLRNIYKSKTMRNFSLFVMPEIDVRLGYYTFEEILKVTYHTMRIETDKKLINKIISRNVRSEKIALIRSTPLFIKSLILKISYYKFGINQFSGVLTNLGKVSFSEEINKKINYFMIIPPPPNKLIKVSCGVVSFNDKLVFTFGSIIKSKKLEQKFLSFLAKQGIPVKIFKVK